MKRIVLIAGAMLALAACGGSNTSTAAPALNGAPADSGGLR